MRWDKHVACMVKIMVKFIIKQAMNALRRVQLQLYPFCNLGTR